MLGFMKKHRILSIFIGVLAVLILVLLGISLIGQYFLHQTSAYRLYQLEQGESSDEEVVTWFRDAAAIPEPDSGDVLLMSRLMMELDSRGIELGKEELLALRNHPAQVIRYQATLQLGSRLDPRNVALLIQALDTPFVKSHHNVMLLLRATTRVELPDDPQLWKEWYKNLPETSEFKQNQY